MSDEQQAPERTEEAEPDPHVWYHFLAKGWECPGHDDTYESTSCIGAVYVG